jgi:hypothetical protein
MKFSMNGKGEKKHSHKEGMGSEEKKNSNERMRHQKNNSQGKIRIVFLKTNKATRKEWKVRKKKVKAPKRMQSEKKKRDV